MIRVLVPEGEGAWTSILQTAVNLLRGLLDLGVDAELKTVRIRRNARVGAYLYPILHQAVARQRTSAGILTHAMIPQLVVPGVQSCCIHDTWTMTLRGSLSWLQRIHYRWAVKRSRLIGVTSPLVGETLARWFGPGPAYLPDTAVAVAPAAPGRTPTKWDLLWVGAASPNKRPSFFLDVLRARSSQLRVRMVCHLNQRWPEEFDRVSARAGFPGLEFSWNALPFDQLDRTYRSSQCIVSTSVPGGEGFHLPIFEAYSRGTRVVVPRCPPYDWIYGNARGVHYYDPANRSSLATAIDEATEAGEFAPDADLIARYSPTHVARRLLDGYRNLGLAAGL